MKFGSFSIVAGTTACNAKCPFCIARATPNNGLEAKLSKMNLRNLEKACILAENSGVNSVLITGKGEPTLFPEQISDYLKFLRHRRFPMLELQTNGLAIASRKLDSFLELWYWLGLTTIAISVVHYDTKKNAEIYTPGNYYFDLSILISNLHKMGFSVRLSVILLKNYIDTVEKFEQLINFAKENNVEQVTLTPAEIPVEIEKHWLVENQIESSNYQYILSQLTNHGKLLLEFHSSGALVFDYKGQNVCISNCLSKNINPEEIRSLIYFPDGHVRYSWQYPGAILF